MQGALPVLLFVGAAVTAPPAQAQGRPPSGVGGPSQGDTVTVGIGIGVTTSYDGARD